MKRNLTKVETSKTLLVTPERHKSLRRLAADRDLNLIEVTDEVIHAGVAVLEGRKLSEPSPCAN